RPPPAATDFRSGKRRRSLVLSRKDRPGALEGAGWNGKSSNGSGRLDFSSPIVGQLPTQPSSAPLFSNRYIPALQLVRSPNPQAILSAAESTCSAPIIRLQSNKLPVATGIHDIGMGAAPPAASAAARTTLPLQPAQTPPFQTSHTYKADR